MAHRDFILGGGITGRTVQHFFPEAIMLEERSPEDAVKLRVFNYGTNYLWKDLDGFKTSPIDILTHVDGKPATEEGIIRYKTKVRQDHLDRSSWAAQFAEHQTGYSILEYPEPRETWFGCRVTYVDLDKQKLHFLKSGRSSVFKFRYLISTIPLIAFTEMTKLSQLIPVRTYLRYAPIYVSTVPSNSHTVSENEIYVNYVSNPMTDVYRTCIRNKEEHSESLLPLPNYAKKIFPGKIYDHPVAEEILKIVKKSGVHCFGRFGCWNSNELVHQTYERIQQWKQTL